MPMFQGTATNKLSMVDAKKIKIDGFGKTIFEEKDFKILFSDEVDKERGLKANFRVSTQKLLDVAIMELTRQNHYKSPSNLNTMVTFSLKDYAKKLGFDVELHTTERSTKEEIKKEKARVKRIIDKLRVKTYQDLWTLFTMYLSWKEPRNGKNGDRVYKDYSNIRVIQRQDILNGIVYIRVGQDIAEYLNQAQMTNYILDLLKVDERNPLTYQLGRKLGVHHEILRNQSRGTNEIIKIESLINGLGSVMNYEEVQKKDPGHWERRIKAPIEKSLDALQESGFLLTWELCNTKGEPLTDEQAELRNYDVYSKLYIKYQLNKRKKLEF